MNTIVQDKEEAIEVNMYLLVKTWAKRFEKVMRKEEYLKVFQLGEDEFNEWFGGALGGQGRGMVPRLTQKNKQITFQIKTLMKPIVQTNPALQAYAQKDAHGGPAVKITCADPQVLWEDTKKWVDQIHKFMPDIQQFLRDSQIDETQLNLWYSGANAAPAITTKLRKHINVVMEKKKKEDLANTREPVYIRDPREHVQVLMGKMKEVQVAAVAATKAMEYVFVPVDVPAGEPVQVPVHKPVPMHVHGCKACTGRHQAHTCAKTHSRKRKAPMAHQVEERDKSDLEQKLQEKLQEKMAGSDFSSLVNFNKQLPAIPENAICRNIEGLECALPPFKKLMVFIRTPMAKK